MAIGDQVGKAAVDEIAQLVAGLPAELQPIIGGMFDRIDKLEVQSAKDANAIADKIIAAVLPEIQAARVEFSAAITEIVNAARRLNGARIELTLGPDGQ